MKKPELNMDIGGIEIKNPVMTASGTFGYAEEFDDIIDLNRLGGIIRDSQSRDGTSLLSREPPNRRTRKET